MKKLNEQIVSIISESFDTISSSLINYIPKITAAVTILFFGIIVSKITSSIIKKILYSTEMVLLKHIKRNDNSKIQSSQWIDILGDMIKWTLVIFFVASSANILEWNSLSKLTEIILSYIPNLIAGIFIILSGLFLSSLAKATFLKTTQNVNIQNHGLIASLIYYITLTTAVFVGVEQIGINIHFITNITIIIIGSLLLGLAFSFTLGSKSLIANFIGSQFAKKNCKPGNFIKINNVEGELIDISKTSMILQNKNKKIIIPSKFFSDEISEISTSQNE